MEIEMITQFSDEDIKNFEPTMKIGLLASRSPDGKPHITLLSSLMASGSRQLCWGQFTEGMSYEFVKTTPQAGFLIMSLAKELWRGKASYTHAQQSGKEYDFYNNTPMFLYNAYFGVHTVHYLDLVAHTGRETLPMGSIVAASITSLAAGKLAAQKTRQVLNPWTRRLMDKLGNLKFLAYIASDGYPSIVPVIQAMTPDAEHVLFSTGVYGKELSDIPHGSNVALFGLSLDMTDVLLRGQFEGIKRVAGIPCASVCVDWVYNSMPPNPGVIYPKPPLEAVREF
jgi:hypothetical protein